MMELSIVTTLYKSELFLEQFINEIIKAINELSIIDYEIIFVNDGSPDNSLSFLIEKKITIPQIKIVDLSRNFGHHYAIQAGLVIAKGEFVFLIDNDLEVSPAFLLDCYREMENDETLDVVYGFQEQRKGNYAERISGNIFWVLINKLSDTKIPHNMLTERLMKKQYVNELLRLNDANLFIGGMFYWIGFNQKGLHVKKGLREGESTYSVKKRLELMLQAITSFSGKPLVWLLYFGFLISFLSVIFIIYLVVEKIVYQDEVQLGWTSIVAINVLILGVISTFLGIIGIYIYKIFNQVQDRPNTIIKKIYD